MPGSRQEGVGACHGADIRRSREATRGRGPARGRTPKGGARTRLPTGAFAAFAPYPGSVSTSQPPGAEAADPAPIPAPADVPRADAAPAPAAPASVAPAPAGGVLSRPYLALSLGIVSVVLLIAFEATAVGTAMPVAARELHGVPLYAFAFSAYFTTSLFAMVLAGQWADRAGPLAPITLGIGGFAAGLLLCGTARSMWVFVLGRAVQGLGGGLVIVALYVVVSRAYPRRLQPAILAAFSACWVVPSVVGPLLAGTVTEHLGWRWVFLGIPVLILLPLLLALPQIRRRAAGPLPDATPAPRGRLAWAFALSLAAGLLQYAAGDPRWWSLPPALVGAVLLALAVRVLLPRGTWHAARGLPAVVLLRGVAAGAFIAAESFVPLMLVTQRGLSPTLAGLSLALGGSTWAFGSWVQARPAWAAYRRTFMTFGMVLVAGAIATAPGVLLSWTPVWIVAVAWGLRLLRHGHRHLRHEHPPARTLRTGGGGHERG
ncbi:major facilitator superfamily transporter, partial [Streptomyces sp. SPB074]